MIILKKDITDVESYLSEVRKHLVSLPDADAIVSELRSHIWDTANKISIEDGVSVEDSFRYALAQMEDPSTLASNFIDEEVVETKPFKIPNESSTVEQLRQPVTAIPENKVNDKQFFALGIAGFIIVMLIAAGVSIDTGEPIVFLVTMIIGSLAIGAFTFMLYFYDNKLFNEQLEQLRDKFNKIGTKIVDDVNKTIDRRRSYNAEKKANVKFVNKDGQPVEVQSKSGGYYVTRTAPTSRQYYVRKGTKKGISKWAFMEHLGGLIGFIFQAFLMGILIAIDYTTDIPLFNEYWHYTGMILVFSTLGIQMIASLIRLIVGRIRATRLITAFVSLVVGGCAVALVIIYPFTIGEAVNFALAAKIDDPEFLDFLVNYSDSIFRAILAITAGLSFMKAAYNIFKFGSWKPTETKSLLVRSEQE